MDPRIALYRRFEMHLDELRTVILTLNRYPRLSHEARRWLTLAVRRHWRAREVANIDDMAPAFADLADAYFAVNQALMILFGPAIEVGSKVVSGGRKGGRSRVRAPEVVAQWQAWADELAERSPHLSARNIRARVAKRAGVSPDTIKRHVQIAAKKKVGAMPPNAPISPPMSAVRGDRLRRKGKKADDHS